MARPSAQAAGMISTVPTTSPVEDDSATPSSSGSELFDREPKASSRQERWRFDIHGDWPRYASTESATSTGLSSMCSSVATNDKQLGQDNASTSSSKKRMADGRVKSITSIKLSSSASSTPQPTPTTVPTATAVKPEPDSEPKKRRGRPPKQKEPQVHFSLKARRLSEVFNPNSDIKPRSSIPSRLRVEEYATQCLEAAYSSRLDPFALHPGEQKLLQNDIISTEVTIYLNIRNAILRLWCQNPLVSVTAEEAAGCVKETRFFGLAQVAYLWLVRNGYINFGCVEVPQNPQSLKEAKKHTKQRTIVVVGAGVSGLATARQLQGLIAQAADHWCDVGEKPPRVVILEGRKRVGGRVYSKPFRTQVQGSLPDGLRNTAEMGAMIVTGFERGNPLDAIIRAQLGLRYHVMTDALTIYDTDGEAVDDSQDNMVTELYTDISDRVGEFRAIAQKTNTMDGDKDLISRCRDPIPNGFATFQLEPLFNPADNLKQHHKPTFKRGRRRNAPPGTEKLTGRSQVVENTSINGSAAHAAEEMGFELADGVSRKATLSLHSKARASSHPTLGAVMDEAIEQYQQIIDMTPRDMRLLNWHHANLEYANAAPVTWLSLSGHDQDNGNEFEGAHSEVVGGYSQVPRGLMSLPTKLDVRFDKCVESIHYDELTEDGPEVTTKVVCTDGDVIEADQVVLTAPLGVLKTDMIDFDPPLPGWKYGAIQRMGFGLLNKMILLYDKPFWDDSRDMFGLLNEAEETDSLDPVHYEKRRGRFYLVWNCSKICGRPMLVALMAGHAAYHAEETPTSVLLDEVTTRLQRTFGPAPIPAPEEVIVTRWKSDKFTRGTYSFVGAKTQAGDYDLMAKRVGNLHFAGEATCGTHPATVHGAFLSGLRVAADVMDAIAGGIKIPQPLVQSVARQSSTIQYYSPLPRAFTSTVVAPPPNHSSATFECTVPQAASHDNSNLSDQVTVEGQHTANPAPPAAKPPTYYYTKPAGPPRKSVVATDRTFFVTADLDVTDVEYEVAIMSAIASQIGPRPEKPKRAGVNPFLLYTTDAMARAKQACNDDEGQMNDARGRNAGGGGRNAVRTKLGQWWGALSEAEKLPYQLEARSKQDAADAARKEYESAAIQWDKEAARIRAEYVKDHPPPPSNRHGQAGGSAAMDPVGGGVSKRKTNVSTNVALDFRMM